MHSWFIGLLSLAFIAPACGKNHDELAAGGRRSSGGASNAGGGAAGSLSQSGGASSGSAGRAPDEPPGANALTLLHGIVDAERVLVCFVVGQGADARALGDPQPKDGLAYGAALVVHALDGVDFATDSLEPVVIAGELDLVQGLDCEHALAMARAEQAVGEAPSAGAGGAGGAAGSAGAGAGGDGGAPLPAPPRLRVGELPSVPAGTLSLGRSFLYVADGCIGGPAFVNAHASDACGDGYTGLSPTLSAVLVAMSRHVSSDRLGLQFVHASLATDAVSLRDSAIDPSAGAPIPIANGVALGEITPRIPDLTHSSADYGIASGRWQLEALEGNLSVFTDEWGDLLTRSALPSLDDGSTYALVLVGPRLDFVRRGFWNAPTFVAVPTDP